MKYHYFKATDSTGRSHVRASDRYVYTYCVVPRPGIDWPKKAIKWVTCRADAERELRQRVSTAEIVEVVEVEQGDYNRIRDPRPEPSWKSWVIESE
jgi:hypothetical protein